MELNENNKFLDKIRMPKSTMRSRFKGHFKVGKKEVEEIWKNAVFVFDANIPLNLYRYSNETREDFLKFLTNHKSRIWMPEQAVREFLENRASTIIDQIRTYDKTQSEIGGICRSFSGSRGHPYISADAEAKLNEVVKIIDEELSAGLEQQKALIHDDPIKEKIADIFGEAIGECYPSDRLKELFDEGRLRYLSKIPPGFKDEGKISNPETESDFLRIYGDWILWRQTMDFAKAEGAPVIFVTDDRKEDWWERKNGKTVGPRPELISEFSVETDQEILIYNFEPFLDRTSTHLESHVNPRSIDEVRAENERKKRRQLLANALIHLNSASDNLIPSEEINTFKVTKRDGNWPNYWFNKLSLKDNPVAELEDKIAILKEEIVALKFEKIKLFDENSSDDEEQTTRMLVNEQRLANLYQLLETYEKLRDLTYKEQTSGREIE